MKWILSVHIFAHKHGNSTILSTYLIILELKDHINHNLEVMRDHLLNPHIDNVI